MEKITDLRRVSGFADMTGAETVYARSIVSGVQRGEVYADSAADPQTVLFWHYCGFARLAGRVTEGAASDVLRFMHCPAEGHSGRLALQAAENETLDRLLLADPAVQRHERYVFEFADDGISLPDIPDGATLRAVDAENFDRLTGRIIPSFSWSSKEEFLRGGFGFCLMKSSEFLAVAFSSAVSETHVDIGVETSAEYRGKGFAKTVALAMVRETLRRGKTPAWACDVRNEGSMRTALAAGFRVAGTHPWYTIA